MKRRARSFDPRRTLAAAILVLLACSGGGGAGGGMTGPGPEPPGPGPMPGPNPDPPPPPPPPPPGNVVEVRLLSSLRFDPDEIAIDPGTTVRWVHAGGSLFHTVTPDGHDEWQEASRSSAGTVLEHTFQGAGEFPYFCDPHRSVGMVGRVTVQ